MRVSLLFVFLGQVNSQVYQAVTATRERKNILGPFTVQNQAACELACNCARGDASGQDCAQFSGVIKPVNCLIYYYTASWCSFLGDYTVNTCILPIVEHQLLQTTTSTTTTALSSTTNTTTPAPTTTTTLSTTTVTASTEMPTKAGCPPGGVWSEWVTGACSTTCGSYTNVTRTRTCTTRCGDCPCDGDASDIGPCGTALCPFPANTCQTGYSKHLNYDINIFFCGTEDVPKVVCP